MNIISHAGYEEALDRLADLCADELDLRDLAPDGRGHCQARRSISEIDHALKIWEIFHNLGPTPFSGQAGRTL